VLRGISPVRDADFAGVDHFHEQLRARYDADLANDLGNLLNRTVRMIGQFRDGIVPPPGESTDLERSVQELAGRLPEAVFRAMEAYDPQTALDAIWELVTRSNKYAEEAAPWNLARAARNGDGEADARLSTALYTLAESVRIIAELLEPFLPETAGKIKEQLGVAAEVGAGWQDRLQWSNIAPGTRVGRAQPIFPRLEQPASAGS
jgi:methionyl-tRNA synthetase